VVDNGSDESLEPIINSCEYPEYVSIKYYKENIRNANKARLIGLRNSNGKYIQFLDSDDELLTGKWENQLRHLQLNENLGVSLASTIVKDDANGVFQKDPVNSCVTMNLYNFLLDKVHPTIGSGLWRNSAARILSWPEELKSSQDWESHLRAILDGVYMEYCNDASYLVHFDANDRIAHFNNRKKIINKLKVLKMHFSEIDNKLSLRDRYALNFLLLRLLKVYLKGGLRIDNVVLESVRLFY